jgi:hypothetical protein
VVERVTIVVRGRKPKVKKTTELVSAWKTMLLGRTNTVIGKITTIFGGWKTKTEKTTILVGRKKTVAGRVAIVLRGGKPTAKKQNYLYVCENKNFGCRCVARVEEQHQAASTRSREKEA